MREVTLTIRADYLEMIDDLCVNKMQTMTCIDHSDYRVSAGLEAIRRQIASALRQRRAPVSA